MRPDARAALTQPRALPFSAPVPTGLTGNAALGDAGAAQLARAIGGGLPRLKGLYLSRCGVGAQGAAALAAALTEGHKNRGAGGPGGVEKLGLNFNPLGDEGGLSMLPLLQARAYARSSTARTHAPAHAPAHAPTHARAHASTHPRTHAPTHPRTHTGAPCVPPGLPRDRPPPP